MVLWVLRVNKAAEQLAVVLSASVDQRVGVYLACPAVLWCFCENDFPFWEKPFTGLLKQPVCRSCLRAAMALRRGASVSQRLLKCPVWQQPSEQAMQPLCQVFHAPESAAG